MVRTTSQSFIPEEYVDRMDANVNSPLNPTRYPILVGFFIFLLFFAISVNFSEMFRTFYQDDNVAFAAPLLIDAARQLLNGHIPYHTFYVGGGGGTPLITILQAGILNPFSMFPALVFHDHPELMINTITCLHLSVFAAGGWFLACCLRAPTWAGLCAAFSLGFSGYYWAMGGYWLAVVMPYAFLPWLIGSIVVLSSPDKPKHLIAVEIVMGLSLTLLFLSGAPNPAFYSALVVFCFVLAIILEDRHRLKPLLKRLIPQALLFFLTIVPVLWSSLKIYEFYGRVLSPQEWVYFSVPLHAYIGLFLPGTYSVWTLNLGGQALMTNFLLGAGAVPVWLVLARLFQKPSAFIDRGVLPLAAGVILSMLMLSPHFFRLDKLFSELPILNAFRFPVRGIPALQVLLAGLFLVLVTKMRLLNGLFLKGFLLVSCVGFGVFGLMHELSLSKESKAELSWFNLMAESRYDDPHEWDQVTIQQLQSGGYLLSLCKSREVYNSKPRIFFHGNLGAQYKVRTVGNYVLAAQCPARIELSMNNVGRVMNWQRARDFLALSPSTPLPEKVIWDNGIGPESLNELASKTYVSSVVVQRGWPEPTEYFRKSPEWKLLDENEWALLFIRNERSGK